MLFLRDYLYKGLYCRYKGKGYIMEVVIIAEKPLLDDLENVKDNLGKLYKLVG